MTRHLRGTLTDSSVVRDEGLLRAIGSSALGLSVVHLVVGAGRFAHPGLVAAELGRQPLSRSDVAAG
jgi:hypothetical protein